MPSARVIEAVDVLKDASFGLAAGFPGPAPNQLGLDGFEERLDNGVVITIALAAHGWLQAVCPSSNDLRPIGVLCNGVSGPSVG